MLLPTLRLDDAREVYNDIQSETDKKYIKGHLVTDYLKPGKSDASDDLITDRMVMPAEFAVNMDQFIEKIVRDNIHLLSEEQPKNATKNSENTDLSFAEKYEVMKKLDLEEVLTNKKTYGYYEQLYPLLNEAGLTMGESTCTSQIYINKKQQAKLTI